MTAETSATSDVITLVVLWRLRYKGPSSPLVGLPQSVLTVRERNDMARKPTAPRTPKAARLGASRRAEPAGGIYW